MLAGSRADTEAQSFLSVHGPAEAVVPDTNSGFVIASCRW